MNGPLPLFPNDALIHLRIHALYEQMGNDNNKILQFVIVTVVGFVCNSRLFKEKVDKAALLPTTTVRLEYKGYL